MADKWNKQKEMENAKIKMLMDDFDNGIFLDETGDFKYTNPDVKAVIRCDDVNHLGNVSNVARIMILYIVLCLWNPILDTVVILNP